MTTSKHWLEDDAPADFERLLRAARSEQPSSGGVERALLAAGIVGTASLASGAAAGAGAAGGAAGKALVGTLTQWLGIGVIAGAAVATTAKVVEYRRTEPAPAAQSAALDRARGAGHGNASKPPPRAPVRPSEPAAPADTPAVEANEAFVARPPSASADPVSSSGRAPLRVSERSIPPAGSADPNRAFAEEMALVEAARASLRAGDAGGALRSASEYNRRYPGGRFAPEALFLLMQARVNLGEHRAAADVAREIIRRFPNGAQVARAREVLESQGELQNP